MYTSIKTCQNIAKHWSSLKFLTIELVNEDVVIEVNNLNTLNIKTKN